MIFAVFAVLICSIHCILASSFLECCGESVLQCLRSRHLASQVPVSQLKALTAMRITMFTYETDNILEYALYSFAVNSIFAHSRGYNLVSTTAMNGFEFENRDQRWNKVKIMETFIAEMTANMNKMNASQKEDRYLVWLDSDLIVLNFALDLSGLLSQYPEADLLVSADVEPLNGMVNTGCMVVRVSVWSRAFFREWWEATDRINGMDQHVFDSLYKSRLQSHRDETLSKIVILPTYILNSHIPASQHQQPHHNVLHLAGESAAVRTFIFQAGFEELCRVQKLSTINTQQATINAAYLAPQLGLSRQFLQSIDYNVVIYNAVSRVWHDMQRCSNIPSLPVIDQSGESVDDNENSHIATESCNVKSVLQLRAQTRDAMQSRDLVNSTSIVMRVYLNALRWALQAHTSLSAEYAALRTTIAHSPYSTQTHLEHLQYVLDASFELLTVDKDPISVQKTLASMAETLNLIQDNFVGANDPSQGPVLYYQFKYYDFLATYYALLHMQSRELESLQQARTTWEYMASLHHYGAGNSVSDPYRELAVVLARMAVLECRDGVHYSDTGGDRFARGLELVLHSAELTASRWLPSEVHVVITRHISASPALHASSARTALHDLDANQLSTVPVKMLSSLIQNYALAARCAKRLSEARENSVLFDAWSESVDLHTEAIIQHDDTFAIFNSVVTKLCEILLELGYECVHSGGSVSVARQVDVSSQPPVQVSDSIQSGVYGESVVLTEAVPKRVVKLRRKRKV